MALDSDLGSVVGPQYGLLSHKNILREPGWSFIFVDLLTKLSPIPITVWFYFIAIYFHLMNSLFTVFLTLFSTRTL